MIYWAYGKMVTDEQTKALSKIVTDGLLAPGTILWRLHRAFNHKGEKV